MTWTVRCRSLHSPEIVIWSRPFDTEDEAGAYFDALAVRADKEGGNFELWRDDVWISRISVRPPIG